MNARTPPGQWNIGTVQERTPDRVAIEKVSALQGLLRHALVTRDAATNERNALLSARHQMVRECKVALDHLEELKSHACLTHIERETLLSADLALRLALEAADTTLIHAQPIVTKVTLKTVTPVPFQTKIPPGLEQNPVWKALARWLHKQKP